MLTQEEQDLIDGVELGIDFHLPVPPESLARYVELIERSKSEVNEDKLHCFVCKLKQHFKEAYNDGFYKTLENQINRILQEMESEQNANNNG